MSVAVIQKSGYIRSGERELMLTVVGVNFTEYADIYMHAANDLRVYVPEKLFPILILTEELSL